MGREALEAFLRGVLDHVADRASQDERYRYWRAVVRGRPEVGGGAMELPPLAMPPRDALVLCAGLDDEERAAWAHRMRTYCMPVRGAPGGSTPSADELSAGWLLLATSDGHPRLWLREGAWYVQPSEELVVAGYPRATSNAYLCAALRPVHDAPPWLRDLRLETLGVDSRRTRVVRSWADVLEAGRANS
jgi:hypothetical protein